ncbi:MAG: hypothetical protein HDT28_05740 [Clostridiales bacterium]|nr:hypothetical protein [Clostridiales bacterium]
MWTIISIAAVLAAVGAFAYIFSRVYNVTPEFSALPPKLNKSFRIALCFAFVLGAFTVVGLIFGYLNALVIVIHLIIFGLIVDLIVFIVRKASGKRLKTKFKSLISLAITIVYMAIAFVLANCVWVTPYHLSTDKEVGDLRIVMFADSHIGTTFDGEGLNKYINEMNELSPDLVIIAGDFVDDDTSQKDMIDGCAAVGRLKPKYGVFYAFGNHDKGYYEDSKRGYSGADLMAELQKNNVTVLQDEAILIDERFYVIGRQEAEEKRRGAGDRADIADIVKDLDQTKYSIVINHQPTDYKNESEAKVDLVLSGHTHGGQFFPLGPFMKLFKLNDGVYGYEKRDNTEFIVTSGIADWAFKFKTGTKSEFVVIDIKQNAA